MIRKTLKMLLVALVAAFALGATAEAAPRKIVHPRARHSSRVSSGNTATATRQPAAKRRSTASAAKRRTQASASTTKSPATRRAARNAATKPR